MRSTLQFKRMICTLGITGAVVVAVSGVAAGSAFAYQPEFRGIPNHYTLKGGEAKLINVNGATVTCQHVEARLTLINAAEWDTVVKFTGCKAPLLGSCSSSGAETGEIVTNEIGLELAYLPGETGRVGIVFNYIFKNPNEAAPLLALKCEKAKYEGAMRGDFIAQVTPTNTRTNNFELKLKDVGSAQEFTEFENYNGELIKTHLEYSFKGGAYKAGLIEVAGLGIETEFNGEIAA